MALADKIFLGYGVVYAAPLGTTWPEVDDDPDTDFGAEWFPIGSEGADSYTEDGIMMRRAINSTDIYGLGSIEILKSAITQGGFELEFNVMDMSPEEVLLALGGDRDDVSEVAQGSGIAGKSVLAMPSTPTPQRYQLLVVFDQSPFGQEFKTHMRIADAMNVGGMDGAISKSSALAFTHVWKSLKPGGSVNAVEFHMQSTAAGE